MIALFCVECKVPSVRRDRMTLQRSEVDLDWVFAQDALSEHCLVECAGAIAQTNGDDGDQFFSRDTVMSRYIDCRSWTEIVFAIPNKHSAPN